MKIEITDATDDLEVVVNGLYIWMDGPTDPVPPVDDPKDGYVSEHFREAEFDCNHCGKHGDLIDMSLVAVLEDVRSHFNDAPITLNSGVRCPTHNRNVGGASNSTHLSDWSVAGKPCAADIVVSGVPPSSVADYLESKDPGKWGIGRYSSFTHIDTRGYSARW